MEELDSTIKQLDDKAEKLTIKKRKLDEQLQTLKQKRTKILCEKYDKVFSILCTPSKNNHTTHRTGCFSTYEKAKTNIPVSGKSYDDYDNCYWYYSVVVQKPEEVDMNKLDKSIPNFPYSGW